jgi:uncharacterized membrane protein
MRRTLALLLLLPLAADALGQAPPSQVRSLEYQALGRRPVWQLTIGDDHIVLRVSGGAERVWPRHPPRLDTRSRISQSRTWQSGEGADAIRIDAWRDPGSGICNGFQMPYPDHVAIQVDGRTLRGCGSNEWPIDPA